MGLLVAPKECATGPEALRREMQFPGCAEEAWRTCMVPNKRPSRSQGEKFWPQSLRSGSFTFKSKYTFNCHGCMLYV